MVIPKQNQIHLGSREGLPNTTSQWIQAVSYLYTIQQTLIKQNETYSSKVYNDQFEKNLLGTDVNEAVYQLSVED